MKIVFKKLKQGKNQQFAITCLVSVPDLKHLEELGQMC